MNALLTFLKYAIFYGWIFGISFFIGYITNRKCGIYSEITYKVVLSSIAKFDTSIFSDIEIGFKFLIDENMRGKGIVYSLMHNKSMIHPDCRDIYYIRSKLIAHDNNNMNCAAIVSSYDSLKNSNALLHRSKDVSPKTAFFTDHSKRHTRAKTKDYLFDLFTETDFMKNMIIQKIGSPYKTFIITNNETNGNITYTLPSSRKTVIVMVANDGVIHLLLNFLCSLQSNHIDMSDTTILVFLGSMKYVRLIENTNQALAIYLPLLGYMPSTCATKYGDKIFGEMMWLKISSIYLTLSCGYNVLFQDCDIVWYKNPLQYFEPLSEMPLPMSTSPSFTSTSFPSSIPSNNGIIDDTIYTRKNTINNNSNNKLDDVVDMRHTLNAADILFMDDGSRALRYVPFYANTGLFYVRNNNKTIYLHHKLLHSVSELLVTKSHQTLMTKYLVELYQQFGLKIVLLPYEEFPSGKIYHHNQRYIQKLKSHKIVPYVFHMCWTLNSEQKVIYFRDIFQWHLSQTCTINNTIGSVYQQEKIFDKYFLSDSEGKNRNISILENCCVMHPVP